MTDKPLEPNTQPKVEQIEDLPPKDVSSQDEENTKGGRRGPGTQTEDDIYVG